MRKQQKYLLCGKNLMMDISGSSICLISDRKPGQIATLISVLNVLNVKWFK